MNKKGRPRGSPKNHHLKIEGGVWIFRWARGGRDVRRSTGCPKSEVAAAREIRDKWIGEFATRRAGAEPLRDPLLLGELIEAYLSEESGFYDREKGGEQPGTKRSAETDRSSKKRVLRHLKAGISSAAVDPEMLLGLAEAMERETPTPAKATRKKTIAFLAGFLLGRRTADANGNRSLAVHKGDEATAEAAPPAWRQARIHLHAGAAPRAVRNPSGAFGPRDAVRSSYGMPAPGNLPVEVGSRRSGSRQAERCSRSMRRTGRIGKSR